MGLMKSRVKLIENHMLAVDDRLGHSVILDLPDKGYIPTGTSALELCVMSLAGCVETIFILVAEKKKIVLKDAVVEVEVIKPEGGNTITYAKFVINVKSEDDPRKIQSAVEYAIHNCPVGVLFEKAGVKFEHTLNIENK